MFIHVNFLRKSAKQCTFEFDLTTMNFAQKQKSSDTSRAVQRMNNAQEEVQAKDGLDHPNAEVHKNRNAVQRSTQSEEDSIRTKLSFALPTINSNKKQIKLQSSLCRGQNQALQTSPKKKSLEAEMNRLVSKIFFKRYFTRKNLPQTHS